MTTFYDAKGRLTAYALACGYVERTKRGQVVTTLWSEDGVYHVRQHDFETSERVFWESFRVLGQARARFRQALKSRA